MNNRAVSPYPRFSPPSSPESPPLVSPAHSSPNISPWNSPLIGYFTDSSIEELETAKRPRLADIYMRNRRFSTSAQTTQTEEEFHVKNFMQGLKEHLENGLHSDVILNVSGKEFNVHKMILSAHSPVFKAMVTYNTREKVSGIINIEDGDPDTFANLLHFMYSGNVQNLNFESFIDLYTVADKYQITDLCKLCLKYMMDHISLETFCEIMALALRHNEKTLIKMATQYFLENAEDIMKTPKWLIFLKHNLVAGNELTLKAVGSRSQR